MTRRELFAALAALPVLAQTPGRAQSRTPKFSGYPFQLGVASGEPDPHGFVLWTRLAPKPLEGGGMPGDDVQVDWQVAADEKFSKVVASGSETARRELAHSVRAEVNGLDADRWYFYRFRAGSEVSPTARARTTPPENATPAKLRFAFASCQHYESGYFTALRHMAAEDLDLVVHLGDYIYEGKGQDGRPRKHAGGEIVSLEDYRTRHAQYKTDPDLQAAHHACPWIVTWDDHEVDNNYADRFPEEADVTVDDFLDAAGARLPGLLRAHAAAAFGDAASVTTCGSIAERPLGGWRNSPCSIRGSTAPTSPAATATWWPAKACSIPRRRCWATRRSAGCDRTLKRSPASWNVLAQQIMIGARRPRSGPRRHLEHGPVVGVRCRP